MKREKKSQLIAIAEWVMDGEFKFGITTDAMFVALRYAAGTEKGMLTKEVRKIIIDSTPEEFADALIGYKKAKAMRKKQGMD